MQIKKKLPNAKETRRKYDKMDGENKLGERRK
jgi:hypothetical protein